MDKLRVIIIGFLGFVCTAGFAQQTDYRLGVPLWNTGSVHALEYSADGSKLLTISKDEIKVWETSTGRLIRTLEVQGGDNYVTSAKISLDGLHVFAAVQNIKDDYGMSFRQSIYRWEVNTGDHVLFRGDDNYQDFPTAYEVAFTDDGEKLITAEGECVFVWDATDFSLIQKLEYTGYHPHNLLLSHDGKHLFFIGDRRMVYHWNLDEYKREGYFRMPSKGSISLSSDGRFLTSFTENGEVEVYNVERHQKLWSLKESSSVRNVNITSDNQFIGYLLENGDLKIRDLKSGKAIREMATDDSYLSFNFIEFSPNGASFYTLKTAEKMVQVDIKTGEELNQWPTLHEEYPSMAAMSPDGKQCTLAYGSEMQMWNTREGKLEHSVASNWVGMSKSSPNQSWVFMGSEYFPGGTIYSLSDGSIDTIPQNLSFIDFISNTEFLALEAGQLHICKIENPSNCNGLPDFGNITYVAPLSSNRRYIQAFDTKNHTLIIDLTQRKLVREFPEFSHGVGLSPDGHNFSAVSEDRGLEIFDVTTGNVRFKSMWTPDINNEYFSHTYGNDGTHLLVSGTDQNYLYDLNGDSVQEIGVIPTLAKSVYDGDGLAYFLKMKAINFSQTNDELAIGHEGGYMEIYNFKNSEEINSLTYYPSDDGPDINLVKYTPDGQNLLYNSADNSIDLWDKKSPAPTKSFKGHAAQILSIEFLKNPRYFYSTSSDGKIFLWDLENGKKILEIFKLGRGHLVLLPDGYYMGTQDAIRQLYYIDKSSKTIGFDQLDVKYNRPDKVLRVLGEVLGNADEELIESYHRAWLKRIQKLKIDTTSFDIGFSVPESDFINREQIAYEQTGSQLKLKIRGKDNNYQLDRYNVWVNDVPVFGQNGVNIRDRNLSEINEDILLTLSTGTNKIETSVMNTNGIESYRVPLYIRYIPLEKPKEQLYFIGIGIDHYRQSDYDLTYSGKDISDLTAGLREKYGNDIIIEIFRDRNATLDNLMKVKDLLSKTTVNDKVIISFSGHGLLSEDLDYYLSTYDIDFAHPEDKGLSYEALESLFDGIPARKKLLLIDACHSGELDKEEMTALRQEADQLSKEQRGSIVVSVKEDEPNKRMGLKNSFELMRELFVNVNKGTGATIIAASAGTQFAYEKGDLKNGVFTYSILNLMKEKESISVSELKTMVSDQVEKLTNGLQKPTARNENIENDWQVW